MCECMRGCVVCVSVFVDNYFFINRTHDLLPCFILTFPHQDFIHFIVYTSYIPQPCYPSALSRTFRLHQIYLSRTHSQLSSSYILQLSSLSICVYHSKPHVYIFKLLDLRQAWYPILKICEMFLREIKKVWSVQAEFPPVLCKIKT